MPGCVAGGEREVGDLCDDPESLGQHRRVGDAERDAGRHDLALPARDPGGHRRHRHEEEPGDVVGRDADDEAQGERAGDLGCERRVAAHEHEAQDVVVDEVAGVGVATPASAADSASTTSSGSLRTAIASARRRSSTRRRAAVISHAAGRSGTPSRGQVRAAASTASASASSTRSSRRNCARRRATRRPHSSRTVAARASSGVTAGRTPRS